MSGKARSEAALKHFRGAGVLFCLVVIVAYLLGMRMTPGDSYTIDELPHYLQIAAFAEGKFDIYYRLTVLPGYHAIIAAMAWLADDHSLTTVRALSWGLCFPAIVLFFLCARELGKDNRFSLSLVFFLSPIFFPFFFLLYTDIPSLMFLLGGLLLTLKRRYQLAGLVVALSFLLRQTNVVWALFYALLALGQEDVWRQLARRDWQPVLRSVARLWLFVLAGFAFLAFVYWHGSITLGDVSMHEVGRLNPTQGYILLFAVFFLFLPLHVWNLPRIGQMIRRRPAMWLFVSAISLGYYIITFSAYHDWNYSTFFLRNYILIGMRQELWFQLIVFIPMLWAAFSLCVTPLQRGYFYLLYPFAILSVLPHNLVEPRYFIVPLTLFMLLKRQESARLDRLTIAMYVPVVCYLYSGIGRGDFFI